MMMEPSAVDVPDIASVAAMVSDEARLLWSHHDDVANISVIAFADCGRLAVVRRVSVPDAEESQIDLHNLDFDEIMDAAGRRLGFGRAADEDMDYLNKTWGDAFGYSYNPVLVFDGRERIYVVQQVADGRPSVAVAVVSGKAGNLSASVQTTWTENDFGDAKAPKPSR